ncbi:PAS domain-containing protein [Yersinia mollaretii]|uniref:PAS domain-containing protein n=1 Tax=Yersinia mollaretii TaxID=33060 RepID=UPI0025AA4FD0|nr:PAS domain-containing protein [Yersinia mollaretii]MDN0112739.1 PAS domain-containing protein [Yersinia mollaretii]
MSCTNNKGFTNKHKSCLEIPAIFQIYMDNLDEPCGIKDESSTFVYANKAYHDLLALPNGYSVIGRLDSELPAATSEYASMFQAHDRLVENTGKRRSSLEIHPFGKEQQLSAYFFDKTPFPGSSGKTAGTFFHGRKAEHLSLRFYTTGDKPESLLLTLPSNLFSETEWLVIFYLRSHLCRKEIAIKLSRSEGYVKNIIAIIYDKAGVRNTRMLIEFIRVNGWHRYVPEQLLTHFHRILP